MRAPRPPVNRNEIAVRRRRVQLSVGVSGNGPQMLFLHGLTGTAESQRGNAPTGFAMASFDQRGHGSTTELTSIEDYVIDEFVGDAVTVLDALGWTRAIVCGASMGAAVAMKLALQHPDRVDALALAAPAFADVPNEAISVFDRIADTIEQHGIDAAIEASRRAWLDRGVPRDRTGGLDAWRAHDATSIVCALRTVSRWTPFPDLDSVVVELCMPIVVACWPGDPMHPEALAERIAGLAGAPVARLTSVAQAQANPECVGAALAPLLMKVLEGVAIDAD